MREGKITLENIPAGSMQDEKVSTDGHYHELKLATYVKEVWRAVTDDAIDASCLLHVHMLSK